MQRVSGNLTCSCSLRAARRTYFALLSPDQHVEIAQFVLILSRTQHEWKSLPKLLLPENSPLPAVLSKVFRVLELSSSAYWPSFIGTDGTNSSSGTDSDADVGVNLIQDQKYHQKILREFLPHIKKLRIRADDFKDGRFVRSFCKAMIQRCVHVASLDIKVGVLPGASPAFAAKIVNVIGNKLTSLSLTNSSNIVGFQENLNPLVSTIARACVQLVRFEFSGHHADALLPIYNTLGGTLLEVKIVVLSTVTWLITLGSLQRNCRRLRSVHVDSGTMVSDEHLAPSGPLTDLLMSYGSQLLCASVTNVSLVHIPLLISACPAVRVAVTYGERWINTAQRMSHLVALGSKVRMLCLDGLEDYYCELVTNAMAACDKLENILIEDIHTNLGVKALFSSKHTRLRRVWLSLCNEKLIADSMCALANSTRKLRDLELQMNHSGGSYSNELYKIASANTRLERFTITEYGRRNLRSAIALVKSILDFVECGPNLKRININLRPNNRAASMKWNDEIATLLLPYRRRKRTDRSSEIRTAICNGPY